MKLYEINHEIESLVDEETGEIADMWKFEELQISRQEKLANIALLAKNAASDIQAIKTEEDNLKSKRKAAERTLSWCKETLKQELGGKKLKDDAGRFNVYYIPTESIKVNDFSFVPEAFIKPIPAYMQESLIDKTAVKKAIKAGGMVPGCELVTDQSVCIR